MSDVIIRQMCIEMHDKIHDYLEVIDDKNRDYPLNPVNVDKIRRAYDILCDL